MEVKDIIKNRRLELGLTMKQVADAVGVSEATISRWESGDIANMRRDRIFALAKKLGISPLAIMGEDPQPVGADFLKQFIDVVSTMSEEEKADLKNYMNFIISKRQ